MSKLRRHYNKIARKLTLADLQEGAAENDLTLDNLFSDGRVKPITDFFLGLVSKKGLYNVLEQFELLDRLAERELTKILIETDTSDPHVHRLYIYTGSPSTDNVICELVAKKGPFQLQLDSEIDFPDINPNLLQIEWLLLQNPRKHFSATRPRLPGQSHPGLGLGRHLLELMIILTRRLGLDGIVNKPHFLHTALMFESAFQFIAPRKQAIMQAIQRDLLDQFSFYTVAWAANFECIVHRDSKQPLEWEPGYLILPLKRPLIKYFRSKNYQNSVEKYAREFCFAIDQKKFRARMEQHNLVIF